MNGPDWDGDAFAPRRPLVERVDDFPCCSSTERHGLSPAELAQARDEADPDIDPVDRHA